MLYSHYFQKYTFKIILAKINTKYNENSNEGIDNHKKHDGAINSEHLPMLSKTDELTNVLKNFVASIKSEYQRTAHTAFWHQV